MLACECGKQIAFGPGDGFVSAGMRHVTCPGCRRKHALPVENLGTGAKAPAMSMGAWRGKPTLERSLDLALTRRNRR